MGGVERKGVKGADSLDIKFSRGADFCNVWRAVLTSNHDAILVRRYRVEYIYINLHETERVTISLMQDE